MAQIPIPAPPGKKLDWIVNNWSEHRVVKQIECEDGYKLSVQASGMHYCTDAEGRREFYFSVSPNKPALPFATVEVSAADVPDSWEEYDGGGIYAFVPVDKVRELIDSHGGEKGAAKPASQLDRIEALLEKIAANTTPPSPSQVTIRIDDRKLVNPARNARFI